MLINLCKNHVTHLLMHWSYIFFCKNNENSLINLKKSIISKLINLVWSIYNIYLSSRNAFMWRVPLSALRVTIHNTSACTTRVPSMFWLIVRSAPHIRERTEPPSSSGTRASGLRPWASKSDFFRARPSTTDTWAESLHYHPLYQ